MMFADRDSKLTYIGNGRRRFEDLYNSFIDDSVKKSSYGIQIHLKENRSDLWRTRIEINRIHQDLYNDLILVEPLYKDA